MRAIDKLVQLWESTSKATVWEDIQTARVLAKKATAEGSMTAGEYMEGFVRLCTAVHNKTPPAG